MSRDFSGYGFSQAGQWHKIMWWRIKLGKRIGEPACEPCNEEGKLPEELLLHCTKWAIMDDPTDLSVDNTCPACFPEFSEVANETS